VSLNAGRLASIAVARNKILKLRSHDIKSAASSLTARLVSDPAGQRLDPDPPANAPPSPTSGSTVLSARFVADLVALLLALGWSADPTS
jgi:hypothetical protein